MKTKDKYIWYSTAIILVVIVAVYALYRYDVNANREIIQGTAECRTYRASSKIPGRIDSMFVSVIIHNIDARVTGKVRAGRRT